MYLCVCVRACLRANITKWFWMRACLRLSVYLAVAETAVENLEKGGIGCDHKSVPSLKSPVQIGVDFLASVKRKLLDIADRIPYLGVTNKNSKVSYTPGSS